MDERELLRRLFDNTPCLIVDGDAQTVELCTAGTVLDRMAGGGSRVIMDAGKALRNFSALVGDRDTFTTHDLVTISGRRQQYVALWMEYGLLRPSVRRGGRGVFRGGQRRLHTFSFRDAFLCGLLGSLSRQRIGTRMLAKVGEMFYAVRPSDVIRESDQVAEVSR